MRSAGGMESAEALAPGRWSRSSGSPFLRADRSRWSRLGVHVACVSSWRSVGQPPRPSSSTAVERLRRPLLASTSSTSFRSINVRPVELRGAQRCTVLNEVGWERAAEERFQSEPRQHAAGKSLAAMFAFCLGSRCGCSRLRPLASQSAPLMRCTLRHVELHS